MINVRAREIISPPDAPTIRLGLATAACVLARASSSTLVRPIRAAWTPSRTRC